MSLWKQILKKKHYSSLQENREVDTLIIGGGMSGLHSLYFMDPNSDVILVEANEIGQGVSANSTAKINYLQESTLGYFVGNHNYKQASLYLKSQLEGIALLKKIIASNKIKCHFESVTSYLVTNKEQYVPKIFKIKEFLEQENISVKVDIPEDTDFIYGIGVDNTYVFHPMEYMYQLASCLDKKKIFEHTRILKIEKKNDQYFCYTDQGFKIVARRVVVACHYPFFLFPYILPLKTSVEKSYIWTSAVSKNLKYTYITLEKDGSSSRFYENGKNIYQIYLGNNHDTFVQQNDLKNFQNVREQFDLNNPFLCWSNVDILTFDHLPIIGKVKDNFYLMTGYQSWGMIQSVLGGRIIGDLLSNHSSDYEFLFSPKRKFFLRLLFLPYYLIVNGYSFLKSHWYLKKWYSNRLTFFNSRGKLIAKYQDKNGEFHYVSPICPHMKCGLIFNEQEETWDCPCHSSRFDMDGNVLKGPSTYSISCKEEFPYD